MTDNADLFSDGPDLVLCEGCHNYFSETDLKKCTVCGKYYCSTCQKTHNCMASQVEITPLLAPEPKPKPVLDSDRISVNTSDSVYIQPFTPDKSYSPLRPSNSTPTHKPVSALSKMVCDSCGNIFPTEVLLKCHKCGAILCPACRRYHKCKNHVGKKKGQKKQKKNKKILALPLFAAIKILILVVLIVSCGIVPFGLYNLVHSDVASYTGTPVSSSELMTTNYAAVEKLTTPEWKGELSLLLGQVTCNVRAKFNHDGLVGISGTGNVPLMNIENKPFEISGSWVYLGDDIYQLQINGGSVNFKCDGDTIEFAINLNKLGLTEQLVHAGVPEALLNIDIPLVLKK